MNKAQEVPIPERLKKFPLYKGMLVHFTVFVGDDGVPDFKVVNENNRIKCMAKRLCALCGEELGKEIVFIGGDSSIKQSIFVDGPMDEACAIYATQVCPYLKDETWEHTDREARHKDQPGTIFTTFKNVPISRPKMGMYYTDGYEIVRIDGNLYYHASMPFYVKWNMMPQPHNG